MKFEVTILGCGAALAARGRHPSSQVVNIRGGLYMVDCGEGTQERIRENHIRLQRLGYIFISHLHGDHYLGLMGLISSLSLLGREKAITVYGPQGLKEIIELQLSLSKSYLRFPLHFVETSPEGVNVLLDTKDVTVYSLPLRHRIPTTGFIFKEKKAQANMSKEAISKYKIGVRDIHLIKQGGDLTLENGEVIPHEALTSPAPEARSYAYCSDTSYLPENVAHIRGVSMLYHEATFIEKDIKVAKKTRHSTSAEAAEMAKAAKVGQLIIGHFSSRYSDDEVLLKEAKEVFHNTLVAEEGKTYQVNALL